jgi:hypothetical protein
LAHEEMREPRFSSGCSSVAAGWGVSEQAYSEYVCLTATADNTEMRPK